MTCMMRKSFGSPPVVRVAFTFIVALKLMKCKTHCELRAVNVS